MTWLTRVCAIAGFVFRMSDGPPLPPENSRENQGGGWVALEADRRAHPLAMTALPVPRGAWSSHEANIISRGGIDVPGTRRRPSP
jgi:hypothetical protein